MFKCVPKYPKKGFFLGKISFSTEGTSWNLHDSQTVTSDSIPSKKVLYPASRVSPRYWENRSNRVNLFRELASTHFQFKQWEEWYDVDYSRLVRHGARTVLDQYYNSSVSTAVMDLLPENDWQPWRFKALRRGFWHDAKERRLFFEKLGKHLDLMSLDDYYRISKRDIIAFGGSSLLRYYSSPMKAIIETFPEHKWKPWLVHLTKNAQDIAVDRVPAKTWTAMHYIKLFIEDMAQRLGFDPDNYDEWYKVSSVDFVQFGGAGLLKRFEGSHIKMLQTLYPEHDWKPWKFAVAPRGFWANTEGQRDFMEELGRNMRIQEYKDWYRQPTLAFIAKNKGKSLITKYNYSIIKLLSAVFQEHEWNRSKMVKVHFKRRLHAFALIKNLFQRPDTQANYLISLPSTKTVMLDVFIPSLKLGFIYPSLRKYIVQPTELARNAEESQVEAFRECGISLVYIPNWWNGTADTLQQLIAQTNHNLRGFFMA
eukprot:TRINITY_DN2385_c1_g1_i1.p1 TRINITY_DN2385_c1_g1~~TRINITY_DN2385_c1_g1_i1.p1  ORF type:complete len:481 (+),score=107.55 TRINITY_DN2385_c1_g1_i1:176-1618(+)